MLLAATFLPAQRATTVMSLRLFQLYDRQIKRSTTRLFGTLGQLGDPLYDIPTVSIVFGQRHQHVKRQIEER